MYEFLIDQMRWSYSRINTYVSCPYSFLLKYIFGESSIKQFFSEYGSFMHSILADFYSGNATCKECQINYVTNFTERVDARPPSLAIFQKFFEQGKECCQRLKPIDGEVLAVENEIRFQVANFDFLGFVDLVYRGQDNSFVILDHKSHNLRPNSGRIKPTFYDIERENYLRQLYLYAIPISRQFGQYPDYLELMITCCDDIQAISYQ